MSKPIERWYVKDQIRMYDCDDEIHARCVSAVTDHSRVVHLVEDRGERKALQQVLRGYQLMMTTAWRGADSVERSTSLKDFNAAIDAGWKVLGEKP